MINVAVALQDDQTNNLYEIAWPNGVPGGGNPLLLQYRMDQQFDQPQRKLSTYNVEYQGILIPKVGSKEETTKEFTLNFRLDSNWEVYRALETWFSLCFDEKTGIYSGESDTRVPMVFRAFGPGKQLRKQTKYEGVKITGFKTTPFDMTNGEASRVEADFIYAYINNDL